MLQADKPSASLRDSSTRTWTSRVMPPSRRATRDRFSVTSFDMRKTEARLSPDPGKAGSSSFRTTSPAPVLVGITEETKASVRSLPCGSAETTSAGRTFVAVRSVNGNGTRTMSLRRNAVILDGLPVLTGIDVLSRVGEEVEGTSRHRYPRDDIRRHVIIENDDRDLRLFRQLDPLKRPEHSVITDCSYGLAHRAPLSSRGRIRPSGRRVNEG